MQACDGKPLPSGRIIARDVECNYYQDARAFLKGNPVFEAGGTVEIRELPRS